MVNAYSGGSIGGAGIGLAFAFVVTAMIFALGHLSGAHINPAVTIAFWSVRRFPGREIAPYLLAQCTGAVLASLTLRHLLGDVGGSGATLPRIGIWQSLVVEALFSFVLMLVIMAVATDDRVADGFAALAVGLTVGFCALLGSMTGSSMNPARSLGPAVVGGGWAGHWIYWLAPVAGMMLGARVYDFLRQAVPPAKEPQAVGVQAAAPPDAPPP